MKLSKSQIDQMHKELSAPFGYVTLMCDGYRVNLVVERSKGMTYRVMTYINGVFKGAWFSSDAEYPEQKFLRRSERPLYSAAKKAKLEKILGKRAVAKDEIYQRKIVMFYPDWASGKSALNHLCKVCESVEVIEKIDN